MKRSRKDLSETELEILKVVWEKPDVTIREVADVLYPGGDVAHYATVQSLFDRLEEKGYVRRGRAGRAHTFTAAVSREELVGIKMRDLAQKLCDGSLTPLLTHLVRGARLSEREEGELRDLVRELSRKKKPGPRSR